GPVELEADGPGVLVAGEAGVVEEAEVAEGGERGRPAPAGGGRLLLGGLEGGPERGELGPEEERLLDGGLEGRLRGRRPWEIDGHGAERLAHAEEGGEPAVGLTPGVVGLERGLLG